MSKSYKSGPRFGPNAWTWKDKAEKGDSVQQDAIVPTPVAQNQTPVPEKKIEQAPKQHEIVIEQQPAVEEKVQQPAVEVPVDESKEVQQDKVITKKK